MLHIVFFILKVILFLLLSGLAVILAVVLSVLLAPVRYQGEASLHEKFSSKGKISWLFHLAACSFSYGEEGLKTELRVLWFYPFREKTEKESELKEESVLDENRKQKSCPGENGLDEEADKDLVTVMERQEETEPEKQEVFPGPTEFSASVSKRQIDGEQGQPETDDSGFETSEKEKKRRKGLIERLEEKVEQLKRRFFLAARRARKAILNLKQKKDSLSALMTDEKNKKTFHLLIRETKRICRKLFPDIRGSISFGIEDPYLMGQILTVLAFFYPYYGRSLETAAVFNENMLEGDISVKGKFCFGTFAVSGLRVWRDRNFRTLMKRFWREGGI